MKLFDWRWFVVSSVLVCTLVAETRPQYGGTLHVAMRVAPASLDPADRTGPDSFARRSLTLLIFDTLVTDDETGRVQPSLAVSWQALGNHGCRFQIRRGVKFHDGTPLTADVVAASLRIANPSWNVSADGDFVIIGSDSPAAELLAELAMPRNAIAKRNADSKPSGTGPFHIVDFQPGKKLTLAAEESCWRGRPYIDGIEIEMGRSYRDQMMAVDLGKAELVEVPAEQVHRASLEGRSLETSSPVELLALVFTRDVKSPDEKLLRESLALSIERASIRSVLLQGAGQPAGDILPNWISGYGFVFPTDADLVRARHDREQVRTIPNWTLGYDGSDSVARLLAERVALNAKDAGLSIQPTTSATTDLRLTRIPLASTDPWIALEDVSSFVGSPEVKSRGGSVEDLYVAEQSVLASQRVIPLFHLPASYAAAATLKNWTLRPDGTWTVADAWLGSRQP
jgi:ABC-type transport system substrate-binding protein